MTPYIVRQGDYLAKIALRLGLAPDDIWRDPQNTDLTGTRDPNVLLPGDVLWVPESPGPEWLSVATGTTNRFVANMPTTSVHLVFGDPSAPLANEPCTITGLTASNLPKATGGDGSLTLKVPVGVESFDVAFPGKDLTYTVHVGYMDPIGEPSGVTKRVHNLGFCDVQSDEASGDLELMAIAAFQGGQGLPITGELDDDTRAALLAAHGS